MDKSDKFGSSASPLDSGTDKQESDGTSDTEGGPGETSSTSRMPFIYRRKNVKDQRDQIHIYITNATEQDLMDVEREFNREFEDDTVYSLDVREAVIKAGLENVERAEEIMEEWGYGLR